MWMYWHFDLFDCYFEDKSRSLSNGKVSLGMIRLGRCSSSCSVPRFLFCCRKLLSLHTYRGTRRLPGRSRPAHWKPVSFKSLEYGNVTFN